MMRSIRFRLYLVFGMLSTLIVLVAAFEAGGMRDVGRTIDRLAGTTVGGIQSLARIGKLAAEIRIADARAILADTTDEQDRTLAELRTRASRFQREVDHYAAVAGNPEESRLYRTLQERSDAFVAGQEDFERQFAGHDGNAVQWYRSRGRYLHEQLQAALDALIAESDRQAAQDVADGRTESLTVSTWAGGMLAATLLVACFALLQVGMRIIEPLARLTTTMRGLSQSDWSVDVPATDRQDEIGEMARAVLGFRRHGIVAEQAAQALRAINADLERLAMIDPLTGVANRRYFYQRAAIEIEAAHRRHSSLACLMLDIDRFKLVNDRYGHAVGDQVLKRVASVLQAGVRPYDLLGRLGGEEFAVLLTEADLGAAMTVAERLRAAVAAVALLIDGTSLSVTISVGVSVLLTEDMALDPLLDRADRALYQAKNAGRNRVIGPGPAAASPPARASGR